MLWKTHLNLLPQNSSTTDQIFAWPHILSLFLLQFPVSRNGCLCFFSVTVIINPEKCNLRKGWFILVLGPFVARKCWQLGLKQFFALCMPSAFSLYSHLLNPSAPAEVTPTIKVGLPISINVTKTDFCQHSQGQSLK